MKNSLEPSNPWTLEPYFLSKLCVLLLLPALGWATDISVVGVRPGRSADVAIEGGAPLTIDVGETVGGVTLLRADGSGAVLRVDGTTKRFPIVSSPASDAAGSQSVSLTADARGQFFTSGVINGRPVRFMVDTGASLVSLSRADAQRIGLDYRKGRPTVSVTANGLVRGWQVWLDSVRVGGVTEHNVEADVAENNSLPVALLGMSFLNRFNMHRQGSTLVLQRHH